jgi:hypothetical protein
MDDTKLSPEYHSSEYPNTYILSEDFQLNMKNSLHIFTVNTTRSPTKTAFKGFLKSKTLKEQIT